MEVATKVAVPSPAPRLCGTSKEAIRDSVRQVAIALRVLQLFTAIASVSVCAYLS